MVLWLDILISSSSKLSLILSSQIPFFELDFLDSSMPFKFIDFKQDIIASFFFNELHFIQDVKAMGYLPLYFGSIFPFCGEMFYKKK